MPTGFTAEPAHTLDHLPLAVVGVLARLTDAGHEAALVGGCVRVLLRGARPGDWDVATSAPPDVVARLFPGSAWENRFGTVTVRAEPGPLSVEVTTYRIEGQYGDRRRPDDVRWGESLDDDLARRDFTINAVAWVPTDLPSRRGELFDPFGGRRDLEDRVL